MSDFEIRTRWTAPKSVATELDATSSALQIWLAGVNLTQYTSEHLPESDHLDIPAYHLAEWFAENWWALLWEPRKNEDLNIDDADYATRHSILSGQHGFALPKLSFIPDGHHVYVSSKARYAQYADVQFSRGAEKNLPKKNVEASLRRFLHDTVAQLCRHSINDSLLQTYWNLIQSTDEEEAAYCQLIGSLGLSPYSELGATEDIVTDVVGRLGFSVAMDLCLVADPTNLAAEAEKAVWASEATADAPEVDLTPILGVPIPADNEKVRGYRRGVNAAGRLRSSLGIADTDPSGAQRVFDLLKFEASRRNDGQVDAAIVGAARRFDSIAKFSLTQNSTEQRRFAAARGIYSALVSPKNSTRLLTQAVTRDQQANRAFSAELLAPIAFIKKRAVKNVLTYDDVENIAGELVVSPDVVWKQAENNAVTVRKYASHH